MTRTDFDVTKVDLAIYQEKGSRYRFRGERHAGLWEIFYLDRGRAYVRIGDRRFLAQPGECYLYLPGAFHQHQASKGHALHYITLAFRVRSGTILRSLAGQRWLLPPDLRSLLSRIVFEKVEDLGGNTMRRGLLMEFLVAWLRLAASQEERTRALAKPTRLATYHEQTARDVVERAMAYLESHLTETVSLEAAARSAGVSASHLRKLARKELGISLREALKQARMKRARFLLSHTKGNVKEVAAAVGYRNLAAFGRAFRAVVGMPPSEYARTVAARGPTPYPDVKGVTDSGPSGTSRRRKGPFEPR